MRATVNLLSAQKPRFVQNVNILWTYKSRACPQNALPLSETSVLCQQKAWPTGTFGRLGRLHVGSVGHVGSVEHVNVRLGSPI